MKESNTINQILGLNVGKILANLSSSKGNPQLKKKNVKQYF